MMRTFLFLPPLPRMSGGLAVLLHIGQCLARKGFPVFFVIREKAAWLDEFAGHDHQPGLLLWPGADTPLKPIHGTAVAQPGPKDIWLVPEGWPHSLLPGLRAGARTVVYVQNWAYLLADWPEGLEPVGLPVHWLAVSLPVAWYVEEVTGKSPLVLRPGIDLDRFTLDEREWNPAAPPVIAWMPRKNKALARQIQEIVTARRARYDLPQPRWREINGLSPDGVAAALHSSDLFLATGFPEGCPLPPLEALASGCVGVGFSGFGGWDYMRLPATKPEQTGELPIWLPDSLRRQAQARPGNGFWVSDGDVVGAALAVEQALAAVASPHARTVLRRAARDTACLYGLAEQEQQLLSLWQQARQGDLFV